jgi:hypothetical protein
MFHLQTSPWGKELQKSHPSLNTVRINDGTVNNRLRSEFLGFISTTQQFSTRLTWQKTGVLSATTRRGIRVRRGGDFIYPLPPSLYLPYSVLIRSSAGFMSVLVTCLLTAVAFCISGDTAIPCDVLCHILVSCPKPALRPVYASTWVIFVSNFCPLSKVWTG